jgi:hypothetical protein
MHNPTGHRFCDNRPPIVWDICFVKRDVTDAGQDPAFTTILRRLDSLQCKMEEVFISDTEDMFFGGIHGIDSSVMSTFDLHTNYDQTGVNDHQIKAISTVSVRLLDSNEARIMLFYEKRTSADVSISSDFLGGLLYGDPLIHPPPHSMPSRCLSMGTASIMSQLATPNLTLTLPHRPRRCLNQLSLPPRRPGRHRLVPAVPPAAYVFPSLSTLYHLQLSIRLRQSPSLTT